MMTAKYAASFLQLTTTQTVAPPNIHIYYVFYSCLDFVNDYDGDESVFLKIKLRIFGVYLIGLFT